MDVPMITFPIGINSIVLVTIAAAVLIALAYFGPTIGLRAVKRLMVSMARSTALKESRSTRWEREHFRSQGYTVNRRRDGGGGWKEG